MHWQLFFFSHCKAKEMCLLSWLSRKKNRKLSNVFYKFYKFRKTVLGDTSGQPMVRTVMFSALCTAGGVKKGLYTIDWLDNFLSYYTDINRNRRVSQNRDEHENCKREFGIKQLRACLIRLFTSAPSLAIGVMWLCLIVCHSTIWFDLKSHII